MLADGTALELRHRPDEVVNGSFRGTNGSFRGVNGSFRSGSVTGAGGGSFRGVPGAGVGGGSFRGGIPLAPPAAPGPGDVMTTNTPGLTFRQPPADAATKAEVRRARACMLRTL